MRGLMLGMLLARSLGIQAVNGELTATREEMVRWEFPRLEFTRREEVGDTRLVQHESEGCLAGENFC